MPESLKVEEVAEKYGVSKGTVLAWIAAGELRALNVSLSPKSKRPRWRVSRSALDEFEAARSVAPSFRRSVRRKGPRDGDVIKFY